MRFMFWFRLFEYDTYRRGIEGVSRVRIVVILRSDGEFCLGVTLVAKINVTRLWYRIICIDQLLKNLDDKFPVFLNVE